MVENVQDMYKTMDNLSTQLEETNDKSDMKYCLKKQKIIEARLTKVEELVLQTETPRKSMSSGLQRENQSLSLCIKGTWIGIQQNQEQTGTPPVESSMTKGDLMPQTQKKPTESKSQLPQVSTSSSKVSLKAEGAKVVLPSFKRPSETKSTLTTCLPHTSGKVSPVKDVSQSGKSRKEEESICPALENTIPVYLKTRRAMYALDGKKEPSGGASSIFMKTYSGKKVHKDGPN
ncbi:uncharacterized protein LOC117527872 [Thalassophryne amazonica]|uniref:uncharacterized protein LOC117527872 n=1 Tax=Thalassophryne amazonica TaxID=390379 RepID=UPI0014709A6A|nr:uncharacterized protein LOC117527872 [Thalassophryne amazonica]